MASIIYMGQLRGAQDKLQDINANYVNKSLLNDGLVAIIAKGNRIEGTTAKE